MVSDNFTTRRENQRKLLISLGGTVCAFVSRHRHIQRQLTEVEVMKFKTVAAIVTTMLVSAAVHAVPIVNTNVRPVVLGATAAG